MKELNSIKMKRKKNENGNLSSLRKHRKRRNGKNWQRMQQIKFKENNHYYLKAFSHKPISTDNPQSHKKLTPCSTNN